MLSVSVALINYPNYFAVAVVVVAVAVHPLFTVLNNFLFLFRHTFFSISLQGIQRGGGIEDDNLR